MVLKFITTDSALRPKALTSLLEIIPMVVMFWFFQEDSVKNAGKARWMQDRSKKFPFYFSSFYLSVCLNLPVYSSTEFIKNNDFFVKDDSEFFNAVSYSFS